ncbi:hypothetical protein B484DRAFT_451587 [Ochromonadaceae sp. CCMP2298]|nr:hypothetical protein B484DRAFT_451587 [Ochromonadaceae sp. CCMP2298]|mmetsp:Transcript_19281/g.42982  ORF Transcript_19281/g.42982 Transcript_19281/m.42982 type:complete len:320 (+) Transcript_19281:168-1127(+)
MSSYEKQMQWKKAKEVKERKVREEKASEEHRSSTFNPTMYRNQVPEFIGRARELNDASGQMHIDRQARARQEKQARQSKLTHAPLGSSAGSRASQDGSPQGQRHGHHNHHSHHGNHGNDGHGHGNNGSPMTAASYMSTHSQEGAGPEEGYSSTYDHRQSTADHPANHADHHDHRERDRERERDRAHSHAGRRSPHSTRSPHSHRSREPADYDLSTSSQGSADEPIIELLERERRQWREERERLIQCIHLQQLELTQRSVAAHERAVDIAKEFARAIERFEDRLISVESTVQVEIMAVKAIAESLLQATVGAKVEESNAP